MKKSNLCYENRQEGVVKSTLSHLILQNSWYWDIESLRVDPNCKGRGEVEQEKETSGRCAQKDRTPILRI